jgi:hypothetical protein
MITLQSRLFFSGRTNSNRVEEQKKRDAERNKAERDVRTHMHRLSRLGERTVSWKNFETAIQSNDSELEVAAVEAIADLPLEHKARAVNLALEVSRQKGKEHLNKLIEKQRTKLPLSQRLTQSYYEELLKGVQAASSTSSPQDVLTAVSRIAGRSEYLLTPFVEKKQRASLFTALLSSNNTVLQEIAASTLKHFTTQEALPLHEAFLMCLRTNNPTVQRRALDAVLQNENQAEFPAQPPGTALYDKLEPRVKTPHLLMGLFSKINPDELSEILQLLLTSPDPSVVVSTLQNLHKNSVPHDLIISPFLLEKVIISAIERGNPELHQSLARQLSTLAFQKEIYEGLRTVEYVNNATATEALQESLKSHTFKELLTSTNPGLQREALTYFKNQGPSSLHNAFVTCIQTQDPALQSTALDVVLENEGDKTQTPRLLEIFSSVPAFYERPFTVLKLLLTSPDPKVILRTLENITNAGTYRGYEQVPHMNTFVDNLVSWVVTIDKTISETDVSEIAERNKKR